MKQSLYALLFIIAFFNAISISGQGFPIRVMTFNIRYDNPDDGLNRWDNRKQMVSSVFINNFVDMAGLQEVLSKQMQDLEDLLPGYGHIGVGREDGKLKGEAVPVFYKLERFELIDNGTFWLSPEPQDTGAVGWDAALTRICTWGKFLDKNSRQEFYFLNTHFDHMGTTARTESARLIGDFIKTKTNGLPVILTGDFNSSPADTPYSVLTGPEFSLKDAVISGNLQDASSIGTFNGFGSQKEAERIDMVFYKGRWKVSAYDVLEIKDGDRFISDHWPVVTEFQISNSKFQNK